MLATIKASVSSQWMIRQLFFYFTQIFVPLLNKDPNYCLIMFTPTRKNWQQCYHLVVNTIDIDSNTTLPLYSVQVQSLSAENNLFGLQNYQYQFGRLYCTLEIPNYEHLPRQFNALPVHRLYALSNDTVITMEQLKVQQGGVFAAVYWNCPNNSISQLQKSLDTLRMDNCSIDSSINHDYLYSMFMNIFSLGDIPEIADELYALPPGPYLSPECPCTIDTCPRILLFGLGSGGLHRFFLQHYPCVVIYSMEISSTVIQVSQALFQLDDLICQYYPSTSAWLDTWTNHTNPSSLCRSHLITGDVLLFLHQLSTIPSSQDIPSFDFILSDIFDGIDITSLAKFGQGQSNLPILSYFERFWDQITRLIHSRDGIFALYLHCDGVYPRLRRALLKYYGKLSFAEFHPDEYWSVMVVRRPLNQDKLVNANAQFKETMWAKLTSNYTKTLCDDPWQWIAHIQSFAIQWRYPRHLSHGKLFELFCVEKIKSPGE